MELYGTKNSPYTRVVRVLAAELGLAPELRPMVWRETPDALFELNPTGRVPVLVDGTPPTDRIARDLRLPVAAPLKATPGGMKRIWSTSHTALWIVMACCVRFVTRLRSATPTWNARCGASSCPLQPSAVKSNRIGICVPSASSGSSVRRFLKLLRASTELARIRARRRAFRMKSGWPALLPHSLSRMALT